MSRCCANAQGPAPEGWIAAQVPSTPVRLWCYLHECKHMELHDFLGASYYDEIPKTDAEVELEVMKIFDSEKIKMSARTLRSFERLRRHTRPNTTRSR